MNAITVENLSKRYIIRHQARQDTLRDALTGGFKSIVSNFRKKSATAEEFWALRNLNFNIPAGEVVGIVGRNGAGKSTLLKVLSRITEPTTGKIKLRGRVASLLEVGTGFHPELSGRENIFLNGAILGMSRKEIKLRFDEIVAFAEVERFLDTPVKRYSSGMYVRLAFSVAAHLEPEILIVDEVLAVGDASFQEKCLGRMKRVANSGRTVLFVSHNIAAVQSLCTSGILLKAGEVVTTGSISSVVSRYLDSSPRLTVTNWKRTETPPEEAYVERLEILSGSSIERGTPVEIKVTLGGIIPSHFVVGLHIRNQRDVMIIHSSDEFEKSFSNPRVRLAKFDTSSINVGSFQVEILLAVRNQRFLDRCENRVGFTITDNSLLVAGTVAADWSGTVSPHLVKWQ